MNMKNRKAFYDYEILEKYEAGVVLKGVEVKSIRAGKANLKNSYVSIENGEAFLENAHISEYHMDSSGEHNPLRSKKLLLNKRELRKLASELKEKGLTIVPLSMYFSGNKVKLEIALAKGKKKWDKREAIAKKDAERRMKRERD